MQSTEKGVLPSSELFFSSPSNQAKTLFFYVTCTGHFMYEDTYVLRRENYNSFLVIHITKGSVRIEFENISYVAKKGETVLIDCHKPHSYSSLGGFHAVWFHFDGANADAFYKELSELHNSIIISKNSSEIVNGIYKIYNYYQSGKKFPEAIQSAYIARILGEFFAKPWMDASGKDDIVDKVVNYIEENYEQELSISELAKVAGLSEFYFSRIFKKHTGFTIHEYIIKTKVVNAKELLKSTNLSLREIAYQCGFSNESSFCNTFKKITDMTPGNFRSMDI
ncbi:MAG: AraC family transcriptional regulator [Mobilitalea sp.]